MRENVNKKGTKLIIELNVSCVVGEKTLCTLKRESHESFPSTILSQVPAATSIFCWMSFLVLLLTLKDELR